MNFPRFGGYSPILPAPINIGILSLFQEAMDPDRPRSGPGREDLEVRRAISFDMLHGYFESQTHERAVEVIRTAWERHEPFCLYLRNFGLGARTSDPLKGSSFADGSYFQVIGADVRMEDELFQRTVAEQVAPRLPVVAVENPAFDFRRKEGLPRLTLTVDSWRAVVSDLVAAAEVIVLYFNEPSCGLSDEIAMIRRSGRQRATILVMSTDDSGTEELHDFPVALTWDEDTEAPARLVAAINSVPPQHGEKHFTADAPAPGPPKPPPWIRQEADFVIDAGLVLAGAEFREGKLLDMEDRLAVCTAMAFWGDIPEARLTAFLQIARGQFRRQQAGRAAENLERALDLCESLVRSDRLTASFPPDMFEDIVVVLTPYRDQSRARLLLERIGRLRSSGPVKLCLTCFDRSGRAFRPRPRIKAGHFPLRMYR